VYNAFNLKKYKKQQITRKSWFSFEFKTSKVKASFSVPSQGTDWKETICM